MPSRARTRAAALAGAVLLAGGVLLAGALGGGALSQAPQSKIPAVYTDLVPGVAVGGFDPVAFFKDGKPVEGTPEIALEHEGVTWRFATEANRASFKADPARYAPQYGGYCAWAVAQGYTAKGDPRHWSIVDGKLYLNFDQRIRQRWEGDKAGFITKGDAAWPKLLGKQ